MGWAIALEGRVDDASVLLLFDDRQEAESIAIDIRRRGHRVCVRPFPDRPGSPATTNPQPESASSGHP